MSADQLEIAAYRWPAHIPASAIIQISHGMAEHARRYDHVAASLNGAGFHVYANDHRGHGLSGTRSNSIGDFGRAGWNGLVDDMAALTRIAREREPGLPLILLGHSMGPSRPSNTSSNTVGTLSGSRFPDRSRPICSRLTRHPTAT